MEMSQFLKWDLRTSTLVAAGLCTMLSLHFTSQLVSQHLFYWKNPKEQRAILVIILMAPVYAVNSFFGLVKITGSEALFTFLDSIKECYEAVVGAFTSSPLSLECLNTDNLCVSPLWSRDSSRQSVRLC